MSMPNLPPGLDIRQLNAAKAMLENQARNSVYSFAAQLFSQNFKYFAEFRGDIKEGIKHAIQISELYHFIVEEDIKEKQRNSKNAQIQT